MDGRQRYVIDKLRRELHRCMLPQFDTVLVHFRTGGLLSLEKYVTLKNPFEHANGPNALLDHLMTCDNGWIALLEYCENNSMTQIKNSLISELDNCKSIISEIDLRLISATQNVCQPWNLPPRLAVFTGRKSYLKQLKAFSLTQHDVHTQATKLTTVCSGLGGIGKTQLAIEFVYRSLDTYENILWVPASTENTIKTAYMQFAMDKGLPYSEPDQATRQVKQWLNARKKWLIVFDNAADYEEISPFIPPVGGNVLITSRFTNWDIEVTDVSVFSGEETKQYIESIVKNVALNEDDIEALGDRVGNLPLALAQAAYYIRNRKIGIQKYIELFDKHKAKMLLDAKVVPHCMEAVYSTWNITIEHIENQLPLSVAILRACSCLHSEAIPEVILKEIASGNEEHFYDALNLLVMYSMIKVSAPDGHVYVHCLVQEVSKLQMPVRLKDEITFMAYGALLSLWPYGKTANDHCSLKRELLPHVLTCVDYYCSEEYLANIIRRNPKELPVRTAQSLWCAIDGYATFGLAQKEIDALQNLLVITKKLEISVDNGPIYYNLGQAYSTIAETTKACDCFELSVKTEMQSRSSNMCVLISALAYQKECRKAGRQLDRLLDIKKQLADDFDEAFTKVPPQIVLSEFPLRQLLQINLLSKPSLVYKLRPIIKPFVNTIQRMPVLAFCYTIWIIKFNLFIVKSPLMAFKMEQVDLYFSQKTNYNNLNMEEFDDLLANSSVAGAHALHALAILNGKQKEYAMKRELLERALQLKEMHYGTNHLEVGKTLSHLVNCCVDDAEWSRALELLHRTIAIFKRTYGSCHYKVAKQYLKGVAVCTQLNDTNLAADYLQLACDIFKSQTELNYKHVVTISLLILDIYCKLDNNFAVKIFELLKQLHSPLLKAEYYDEYLTEAIIENFAAALQAMVAIRNLEEKTCPEIIILREENSTFVDYKEATLPTAQLIRAIIAQILGNTHASFSTICTHAMIRALHNLLFAYEIAMNWNSSMYVLVQLFIAEYDAFGPLSIHVILTQVELSEIVFNHGDQQLSEYFLKRALDIAMQQDFDEFISALVKEFSPSDDKCTQHRNLVVTCLMLGNAMIRSSKLYGRLHENTLFFENVLRRSALLLLEKERVDIYCKLLSNNMPPQRGPSYRMPFTEEDLHCICSQFNGYINVLVATDGKDSSIVAAEMLEMANECIMLRMHDKAASLCKKSFKIYAARQDEICTLGALRTLLVACCHLGSCAAACKCLVRLLDNEEFCSQLRDCITRLIEELIPTIVDRVDALQTLLQFAVFHLGDADSRLAYIYDALAQCYGFCGDNNHETELIGKVQTVHETFYVLQYHPVNIVMLDDKIEITLGKVQARFNTVRLHTTVVVVDDVVFALKQAAKVQSASGREKNGDDKDNDYTRRWTFCSFDGNSHKSHNCITLSSNSDVLLDNSLLCAVVDHLHDLGILAAAAFSVHNL